MKLPNRFIRWLIFPPLWAGCFGNVPGLIDSQGRPLHRGAAEGNIAAVTQLLDSGMPVDSIAGAAKATPLHFAARDGQYAMAQLLISRGADVNARTVYRDTPLHLAAGAQVDACDKSPDLPPPEGATEEHHAVVSLLLEAGASVDPTNRDGDTPLMNAAACNDAEIATLLIAHGADINHRGRYFSVLDRAAAWGPDVAKLLIESGADLDTVNYLGETPAEIAVSSGRMETARLLYQALGDPRGEVPWVGAPRSLPPDRPLHDAVEAGSIVTVQQLIADGADVNERDRGQRTPLHMIYESPQMNVARLLVASGADINAQDHLGQTPLTMLAAHSYYGGAVDVARFLISEGADVNLASDGGYTPLYNAVSNPSDDLGMIELLIDHDAEVNVRGSLGYTPLHAAARDGKAARVELLIDRGADINARNDRGETPLTVAEGWGVTRLLRASGAER